MTYLSWSLSTSTNIFFECWSNINSPFHNSPFCLHLLNLSLSLSVSLSCRLLSATATFSEGLVARWRDSLPIVCRQRWRERLVGWQSAGPERIGGLGYWHSTIMGVLERRRIGREGWRGEGRVSDWMAAGVLGEPRWHPKFLLFIPSLPVTTLGCAVSDSVVETEAKETLIETQTAMNSY